MIFRHLKKELGWILSLDVWETSPIWWVGSCFYLINQKQCLSVDGYGHCGWELAHCPAIVPTHVSTPGYTSFSPTGSMKISFSPPPPCMRLSWTSRARENPSTTQGTQLSCNSSRSLGTWVSFSWPQEPANYVAICSWGSNYVNFSFSFFLFLDKTNVQ